MAFETIINFQMEKEKVQSKKRKISREHVKKTTESEKLNTHWMGAMQRVVTKMNICNEKRK